MKKLTTICLLLLLLCNITNAQKLTPPEFPGGKNAFHQFLVKNVQHPATDEMDGIVVISFTVEKDGRLTNIAVKKSLAPAFDKEALRVISLSPRWIAATQDNRPIKSNYTVPIMFAARDYYLASDTPIVRPPESELRVAEPPPLAKNVINESTSGDFGSKDGPDKIYTSVEKLPEFPGGVSKFYAYVQESLKNEKIAPADEGLVIIKFVTERDGSLTNLKVAKDFSPKCDSLAIKLIKNSPKWAPGTRNGRPVRVLYSVPIRFKSNI